jgi:hypothetical protein
MVTLFLLFTALALSFHATSSPGRTIPAKGR